MRLIWDAPSDARREEAEAAARALAALLPPPGVAVEVVLRERALTSQSAWEALVAHHFDSPAHRAAEAAMHAAELPPDQVRLGAWLRNGQTLLAAAAENPEAPVDLRRRALGELVRLHRGPAAMWTIQAALSIGPDELRTTCVAMIARLDPAGADARALVESYDVIDHARVTDVLGTLDQLAEQPRDRTVVALLDSERVEVLRVAVPLVEVFPSPRAMSGIRRLTEHPDDALATEARRVLGILDERFGQRGGALSLATDTDVGALSLGDAPPGSLSPA